MLRRTLPTTPGLHRCPYCRSSPGNTRRRITTT